MKRVKGRPAETAAAAGGIGGLAAAIVTKDWVVAVVAAWNFIPAAVTLLVTNGGVRGVVRLLWRGRDDEPAVLEGRHR